MHLAITHYFKKYHLFGFTGTPIFTDNAGSGKTPTLRTTEQAFGDQLHAYTIVDAINDRNVLPFRVDYVQTMKEEPDIDDKPVWDIKREETYLTPERITDVTKYILERFNQKTYRNEKTYTFNVLQNIGEVASAKRQNDVEEIKRQQRSAASTPSLPYPPSQRPSSIMKSLSGRWMPTPAKSCASR